MATTTCIGMLSSQASRPFHGMQNSSANAEKFQGGMMNHAINIIVEPQNFREASKHPKCVEAMRTELDALKTN